MKQYVVIIAYTIEQYLLLLNRAVSPFGFCLPGGGVNTEEESLKDGACREFAEETGIKISKDDLSFIDICKSENGRDVHVFKLNTRINAAKIKLSREHTGYILTDTLDGIQLAGNTGKFLIKEEIWPRIHLETILSFGKYNGLAVFDIINFDYKYISFLIDKGFKFGHDVISTIEKIINDKKEEEYRRNYQSDDVEKDNSENKLPYEYSGGFSLGPEGDDEYPDPWSESLSNW